MIQVPGEGDIATKYLLQFNNFILGTRIAAKQKLALQEELTVLFFLAQVRKITVFLSPVLQDAWGNHFTKR